MIVSWNWLTQYRPARHAGRGPDRAAGPDGPESRVDRRGRWRPGDRPGGDEQPARLPGSPGRRARDLGPVRPAAAVPDPRPATSGAPVETLTSVTVEAPDLCPRFTARVVSGAKVGESPWWLRKRLETLGVRPISNVVDVTNYVMFECGQPLHAYDLDRLGGRRLVVRRARPGETLTAINSKTYELRPEMLVIADADAAGRPGGRDGRARYRDRPGDARNPDRGGPVRLDVDPPDVAGARARSARRATGSNGRSTPR